MIKILGEIENNKLSVIETERFIFWAVARQIQLLALSILIIPMGMMFLK